MPPNPTPQPQIPIHKINLSSPPQTRYTALAQLYRPKLLSITSLFDSLVLDIFPPQSLPYIKFLARIFLRRVYDDEETLEIRGIADAAGVDVYLVVCFNVLLDLLMGCTSGGVLSSLSSSSSSYSRDEDEDRKPRMLHFRTLDWDMPALRALLVQLEYTTKSPTGEETTIATNITYVGFVGVLTGVRRGLSVSLNFRPNHDGSSWWNQIRYYSGHALVLLGFRRSISSVLRGVVVPSTNRSATWLESVSRGVWGRELKAKEEVHELSLTDTVSRILRMPSTACYLILCDGRRTYVLEKDYKTTTVESSSSFIVATNNDCGMEVPSSDPSAREEHPGASLIVGDAVSVVEFIKDSIERRECMQAHWDMKVARARQAARRASQGLDENLHARRDPLRRTRSSRRQDTAVVSSSAPASSGIPSEPEVTATLDEIVTWTTRYPTTNEMTHFATVMDPVKGTVAWIRRYLEPLECDWDMTDFD
ncbi:beta subunit of N-acylethanolamine-hydrolyzing acid amidase-domain-containing protein [Aspergillus cavernicola]|uniref:ceramidase n=1 Tax=Aspergillus cavernicola TaxID=176166 RepID=A0ABR4IVF3_9EURO